jgi:hypothetical protein
MKEYMPDTHVPGDDSAFIVRAYAAGALSFTDIAKDVGPRRRTSFDRYAGEINPYARAVRLATDSWRDDSGY